MDRKSMMNQFETQDNSENFQLRIHAVKREFLSQEFSKYLVKEN